MKRAMALAALAASMFLVMAAAPSPVGAVVGAVQEFPVTPTGGGGLNRITSGPDGRVWFTAPGANSIGRINADGSGLALFPIPTADSSPIDITTGSDGNLWFTEFVGTVGKITTSGAITEYRVPPLRPNGTVNKNDRAFAFGITAGPDGALWFILNCCSGGDQHVRSAIGRITTAGVITQYDVPAGTTPAVGITTGPDGNLWFPATNIPCGNKNLPCSQRIDGRIQRMTPAGVVTGDFLIPTPYSDPSRIVTGPDGNLWFTEQGAIGANGCCEPTFPAQGKIGRLTPSTGAIAEFPTLPNSEGSFYTNPAGIAAGPDGNIWWTEYSYTTRPRNAEPGGLLHGGNRIGRINPTTFAVTEFPVPTAGARADGITNGPAGSNAMFFTESPSNFQLSAVGKISTT